MKSLRTMVFCTAYAADREVWNGRYRRWVDAIRTSALAYDEIVLFDDGSPVLPDWDDALVVSPGDYGDGRVPVKIVHFPDRLGRKAVFDFPGWYRSFTEAGIYACAVGCDKSIHIESDTFLISGDVQGYVNALTSGWTAFWCKLYHFPESAIQVIAGEQIDRFGRLRDTLPHSVIVGREYELQLPFTRVERRFIGDRYGEYLPHVPYSADYVVSARSTHEETYYWWLTGRRYPVLSGHLEQHRSTRDAPDPPTMDARTFLTTVDANLSPGVFFEVADPDRSVAESFNCPAVTVSRCVHGGDPLRPGRRRPETHIYDMDGEDFFSGRSVSSLCGRGADVAFLDVNLPLDRLLSLFSNIEKNCSRDGVIFLGSALPRKVDLSETDAVSRARYPYGRAVPPQGEAWKLPVILRKYRPDLRLLHVDCAPDGLTACVGLNPDSSVLPARVDAIRSEFSPLRLSEYGLDRLWSLHPVLDPGSFCRDQLGQISALSR